MFEINLVPDVKWQLIRKKHMRNAVISISTIVMLACGGLLFILFGTVAAENLAATNARNLARDKTDQIVNFENIEELLSIQDRMRKIDEIGLQRKTVGRVFGLLDVILLNGENGHTIRASNVEVDFNASVIKIEARAYDEEGAHNGALLAFQRSIMIFDNERRVPLTFYDYGDFINTEGVAIPTQCITGAEDPAHATYDESLEGCLIMLGRDGEEPREPVSIKREMTQAEYNAAKSGRQYYFESECVSFETRNGAEVRDYSKCPLIAEEGESLEIESASTVGNTQDGSGVENACRDEANNPLCVSFTATLRIDPKIFLTASRNVKIIGPSRQNVTDSYLQVRDIYDGERNSQ